MSAFWDSILRLLNNFLYRLSFLAEDGYFSAQWDKYFSFIGFILGLVFLILLYAANKDKSAHPFKGMIRVLMMVAVINSCSAFWEMVCVNHPDADWYGTVWGLGSAEVFFLVENVFSGCLMTLALHTTYRRKTWAGAAFGLVTRLALVLMNYPLFSYLASDGERGTVIFFVVLQSLLIFFLSAIIAKRKYFSTSWLWYVGYQLLPFVVLTLIQIVVRAVEQADLAQGYRQAMVTMEQVLPNFTPFLVISGIILVVGIIFDISVRAVGSKHTT